ncbi:hypothetical protein BGZ95_002408, partial [Linnemannia exigua]
MSTPLETDFAELSFERALGFPSSSNPSQTMNSIHAALGPNSFEASTYSTSSSNTITTTPAQTTSSPHEPVATTMTTAAYYGTGTFDTPYPATLHPSASLQDPRLFASQQQQQHQQQPPPPYPAFDNPLPTPTWASQHDAM